MTQRLNIDGPTVDLNNDRTVCIGYYEDANGRVVGRFAVPPGQHTVPDAVVSLKFVSSLADLPPIDDHYRNQ